MDKKNIIPINFTCNSNSPNSLNGCYYVNKDNKVKIELKEIEKNYEIFTEIKYINDYNTAKQITEIINKILINENGFLRDIHDITIINKNNKVIIKIKD